MASPSDIKRNVTCLVTENGNYITLAYSVADPENKITWRWVQQTDEAGSNTYVAEMIANESKRGDWSQPIPENVYLQLKKPNKSKDGPVFKVVMERKNRDVSIQQYFSK